MPTSVAQIRASAQRTDISKSDLRRGIRTYHRKYSQHFPNLPELILALAELEAVFFRGVRPMAAGERFADTRTRVGL
jgi:hypothetical protein